MPNVNRKQLENYVVNYDFYNLFNTLGWDNAGRSTIQIEIDDNIYNLTDIAQKRSYVVFLCEIATDFHNTNGMIRKKIEQKITKIAYEHLIIYFDKSRKTQIWQWVLREPNQPVKNREIRVESHQVPERLIQRLDNLYFSLAEEESITVVDVNWWIRNGTHHSCLTA